ncbi:LEM-3-like GIY-YIG domain-containing protein [Pararhizobium sp. PWRC1-1]|uniref:LEM-3-like GIY-YIG domain-containing protein n=1 Tax=Pararhizobium sp. PWRC1-1 TaxID=2804566 RepID=UPI003CF94A67
MSSNHRFPEEVCQKLSNYVYRLIDPRNGETFYVGKGRNNRVFDHAAGLSDVAEDDDQRLGPKLDRIRAIKNAGLDVLHVIHRHEIPDSAIFEVEAAIIDAYPGLTNIQGGHASSDKGPMNHLELIDKYSLPEFPSNPEHRLILINVNKLEERFDRRAIYNLVRYCWRISKLRAEKAEYVLAVVRGVVVGAFRPQRWMAATSENFPDIAYADGTEAHRVGFIGQEAPPEIWDLYVGDRGKRVTDDRLRHVQNPIRFWNC